MGQRDSHPPRIGPRAGELDGKSRWKETDTGDFGVLEMAPSGASREAVDARLGDDPSQLRDRYAQAPFEVRG